MQAIVNTKLILEDGIIWDGALTFDQGRIVAAGRRGEVDIPAGTEETDAGGLYTAPGLIDIHNHGSETHMFHEDPLACARHFLRCGETTILPTFYCNLTAEQILDGAEKMRAVSGRGAGQVIGGFYMEGPYMNGLGSNQNSILRTGGIVEAEYAPLVDQLGAEARVWAIDPNRKGIEGFLSYVRARNPQAIFALGHSDAAAARCREIEDYGIRLQTHHGDSGKAPGHAQGTIGSGCDEYTLYHPDMYAEMICDEMGVHLDADMIRMVVRTKGVEKLILITDSMRSGVDPATGRPYLNNPADGIVYGPDLNYDYEGHLAGSHLTLDRACRNFMAHSGCGLCHAIRCATLNPARLLGLDREIGSLRPGRLANLILLDDMVHIHKVFLKGELACVDGVLTAAME